jgi:hypothetical protein
MLGLTFLVLTGCTGGYPPYFPGTPVWKMFPFDGEREWSYASDDSTVPYLLTATCDGIPELIQKKNVYTVHYWTDCVGNSDPDCVTGEDQFVIRWSSDVVDGVFVWAYDVGDGFVDLDPPVQVTYDEMKRDDVITTQTGGATWTSTMLGIEECPIRLAAEWDECGAFEIATDGASGFPIAGTWWAVAGNGVAAFQRPEDSGQWKLAGADCLDDNCDGDW